MAAKTKKATKEAVLKNAQDAVAAAKKGNKVAASGMLVCGLILEGKLTPDEIAARVSKKCGSKTSKAVVYWYRAFLRGLKVELPVRAKKAKAAE